MTGSDNGCSLTVQQLAERWQRRPEWVTQAARQGEIPGAWKLGHLWRFRLREIEAYELSQQAEPAVAAAGESVINVPVSDEANIFALAPGAAARLRNKERRQRNL